MTNAPSKVITSLVAAGLFAAACGSDSTAGPVDSLPEHECGEYVSEGTVPVDSIDLNDTDLSDREKDRIELYRENASLLAVTNPITCTTMAYVPPVVDADSVGAFEVISLALPGSGLRYDAFLYPDRDAALEASASVATIDAVSAARGDQISVASREIGGALFIIRSDSVTAPVPADVTSYYDDLLNPEE